MLWLRRIDRHFASRSGCSDSCGYRRRYLAVLYVYGSVHHGKLYGIAVEADAEDGAAGRVAVLAPNFTLYRPLLPFSS